MQVRMPEGPCTTLQSPSSEGVEFGEYGGGVSCANPLESRVCLPQQRLGLRDVADG
jgi:hypothetical protein